MSLMNEDVSEENMAGDTFPEIAASGRRRARGPALKTWTLALETITPVLGGGPVTRKVDVHTPVRISGIRGQLRLWWRALYAHQCGSARELAGHEAALWGGAGNATNGGKPRRSLIDIWVDRVEAPDRPDASTVDVRDSDAYALWPARGNPKKNLPAAQRWPAGSLRFCLHVRGPRDEHEQIERTLRAWLLFGGIGGRTRRGCGSLTVTGKDLGEWLPREASPRALQRLLGEVSLTGKDPGAQATDTPSLHGALLLHGIGSRASADQAWHEALAWLRDFRQEPAPSPNAPREQYARGPKREKGINERTGRKIITPGPSTWPEPDKVRHLLGREDRRGRDWTHPPRYSDEPAWPRASFGLPIIGTFQQKGNPREKYEPEGFEIRWYDEHARDPGDDRLRDRLASPLIIKAMPLASGRFVPIALWLHRKYLAGEVVLCRKAGDKMRMVPGSNAPFDRLCAEGERAHYAPLNEKETMRDAFCDWLSGTRRARRLKP